MSVVPDQAKPCEPAAARMGLYLHWVMVILLGGAMSMLFLTKAGGRELIFVFWLFDVVLKIRMCVAAAGVLRGFRHDGRREQPPERVLEESVGYLTRTFGPPMKFWCALLVLLPLLTFPVHKDESMVAFMFFFAAIFQGFFLLDLHSLGWIGLWFGLVSKSKTGAILKTFLAVVGLPWLVAFIPIVGGIVMAASPFMSWLMIDWARNRLRLDLEAIGSGTGVGDSNTYCWRPLVELLSRGGYKGVWLLPPALMLIPAFAA